MMEKYIKASDMVEVVKKHSLEAAESWDYDAVVVCGKILDDIVAMPGKYIESEDGNE